VYPWLYPVCPWLYPVCLWRTALSEQAVAIAALVAQSGTAATLTLPGDLSQQVPCPWLSSHCAASA
jgi:hypothetical protein